MKVFEVVMIFVARLVAFLMSKRFVNQVCLWKHGKVVVDEIDEKTGETRPVIVSMQR